MFKLVAALVMAARSTWTAERIARLLPKAHKTPTGYKACCPAHDDKNPSLFIADGNDGIAMRCYAGCDYQSIRSALELKGVEFGDAGDRDGIPTKHFQLGEPSRTWHYRDRTGRVVMVVCRWEQPGGKKDIRPLILTPDGWKWQHHPNPRPLYNLDMLTNEPERPVIVVEGEKAADAAARLFPTHVATTWSGGASSMGNADWSMLAGRDVTLVPDCDEPGVKAMRWVSTALERLTDSIRTVNPRDFEPALPDGWDLADAEHERRDISEWFKGAVSVKQTMRQPLDWRALSAVEPAAREWVVDGWLGRGHVTLLAGPAGAGKTAVSQSIASAVCTGRQVIDNVSQARNALIWAGEDDANEMHRRQIAIARWLNEPLEAFADKLFIQSYPDRDITLAALIDGRLTQTALFKEMREQIGDYHAELVIVDSVARTFGGNENDRHQVTQFVAWLTWALAPTNASLVLLGHPAKAVGSEYSGSTAWEASVRARLYFGYTPPDQAPPTDDDPPPDDNLRYLAKRKTNYSTRDIRQVRWADGCMQPEGAPEPGSRPMQARATPFLMDETLRVLRRLKAMGIETSASPGANFLPRVAVKNRLVDGISERDLRVGLAELLKAGSVRMGVVGKYAKGGDRFGLMEV